MKNLKHKLLLFANKRVKKPLLENSGCNDCQQLRNRSYSCSNCYRLTRKDGDVWDEEINENLIFKAVLKQGGGTVELWEPEPPGRAGLGAERGWVLPWLPSAAILHSRAQQCRNSSGDVPLPLSMCTWGVLNPRVADVINNNVSFGAVTTYHVNGHLGSL